MAFTIGDLFVDLEQFGFFDFVLPFLIVFALVFAILEKSKWLGENKAVQAIISVSIGLLSTWGMMLTEVYKVLFPRMGIFLGVILVVLIFVGFFIKGDDADAVKKFAPIGWAAAVIVLLWTLNFFGIWGGYGVGGFWEIITYNLGAIVVIALTVLAIWAIVKKG
ncbi:hypothetical protein HN747_00055 [archaeon]|jgi:hypothetical protein|nr:hypothetical protein [archaeon]